MKIAILGGTGNIGKGFALRWSKKHQIIIGSRTTEKAKIAATKYNKILEENNLSPTIKGLDNKTAAQNSDIILLAIDYKNIESVITLINPILKNQIIISPIVPIKKITNQFFYSQPKEGSAAQKIATLLPPNTSLISAFHNIPAANLANLNTNLNYSVGVCGDHPLSKNIVFNLIKDIPNLQPLDSGSLETSSMLESITPLMINIATKNNLKDLGIKLI